MLTIHQKNLIDVTRGVIVHGCNCSNGFGSGVAKAIATKWPHVKATYHRTFRNGYPDKSMLGTICPVEVGPELFVINAYTQLLYGHDGRRYADLMAIQTALNSALNFASFEGLDVYMPRIGCGLGGLNWKEVEPIVETIARKAELDGLQLFVCDWVDPAMKIEKRQP